MYLYIDFNSFRLPFLLIYGQIIVRPFFDLDRNIYVYKPILNFLTFSPRFEQHICNWFTLKISSTKVSKIEHYIVSKFQ